LVESGIASALISRRYYDQPAATPSDRRLAAEVARVEDRFGGDAEEQCAMVAEDDISG
jgi:hypothetical protein